MVSDLMIPNTQVWNLELIKENFNLRDASQFLSIPLYNRNEAD